LFILLIFLEHIQGLEQLLERYTREEDEFRQRNDIKKADLSLNKKNLVVKEVNIILFVFIQNLLILLFRLKHLLVNYHRQNQCDYKIFVSLYLFTLIITFFFDLFLA